MHAFIHSPIHRTAPERNVLTQADPLTCLAGVSPAEKPGNPYVQLTTNKDLRHLPRVLCDVCVGHAPVVQLCIGRLLANLTAHGSANHLL